MDDKVYLVDIEAAASSRKRQALDDEKKRIRKGKIAKASKQKPAKQKPSKQKPDNKPKKIYRRQQVAYKPGLKQSFYDTQAWHIIRYKALKLYGRRCACCGTTDAEFHVDHIKPRSKSPELELDIKNLQILCRACNLGKGNTDSIDWRQVGP